jgi:hypothetical protein
MFCVTLALRELLAPSGVRPSFCPESRGRTRRRVAVPIPPKGHPLRLTKARAFPCALREVRICHETN